jgi:hypothetical protein
MFWRIQKSPDSQTQRPRIDVARELVPLRDLTKAGLVETWAPVGIDLRRQFLALGSDKIDSGRFWDGC